MAVLEIEIAAEEQARALREVQSVGLSANDWARQKLFGPPPVTFTTGDGEVYEISALPAEKWEWLCRSAR